MLSINIEQQYKMTASQDLLMFQQLGSQMCVIKVWHAMFCRDFGTDQVNPYSSRLLHLLGRGILCLKGSDTALKIMNKHMA